MRAEDIGVYVHIVLKSQARKLRLEEWKTRTILCPSSVCLFGFKSIRNTLRSQTLYLHRGTESSLESQKLVLLSSWEGLYTESFSRDDPEDLSGIIVAQSLQTGYSRTSTVTNPQACMLLFSLQLHRKDWAKPLGEGRNRAPPALRITKYSYFRQLRSLSTYRFLNRNGL